MRAKDFLKQIKKIDMVIRNKMAEREQWRAIATGTTAQMGGERVQSSGSQQKMADAVGRYVDIEAEIDRCIDTLVDTKRDIIAVIENLEVEEYDVLHKVYVQYFTLDEVASMNGKSYSHITTVHGRALKNVQNILDNRKERKWEV